MSVMLARKWDGQNPRGWLMSEKLDGIRAIWTGSKFRTRNDKPIHAPEWFTRDLPRQRLDGELWMGRGQFQRTSSVVRRKRGDDAWDAVTYKVFDAPDVSGGFEARLAWVAQWFTANPTIRATVVEHVICRSESHLQAELDRITQDGGEGLMLREPGSAYQPKRSRSLLKVKTFRDTDACVIGYEPGKGKHTGRVGALVCELANAIRFRVGTGLTDSDREYPPTIGETIIVKFFELTNAGVPRFPTFVGIRAD